jgi:hypothetical protein
MNLNDILSCEGMGAREKKEEGQCREEGRLGWEKAVWLFVVRGRGGREKGGRSLTKDYPLKGGECPQVEGRGPSPGRRWAPY